MIKALENPALVLVASSSDDAMDFTAFYRDHYEAVRSLLFRFRVVDLDDLVQDVFLKAFRNRADFRAESSPRTWLMRIAINCAKDHLKRAKLPFAVFDPERIASVAPSVHKDTADTVEACLNALSPHHKEVLILCVLEGYTMKEAGDIIAIPEGTIKSRLAAARGEMKVLLRNEGVEP